MADVNGDKGVSRVASVKEGATLTFEFRGWANDPSKERLDRGHKGPCAVYLKKVDSAISDPGHGDGWFKLFDDGYEKSTDQWCTDKLIDNNGLFSVVLPKGLKGGYYLARPEILALHAANAGDPQFYAGCAQIFLEGNGDLVPEETVAIPGYVKAGEPSVSFNIYNTDNSKYTIPGPSVAKLSSSSSAMGTTSKAQTSQTEGLRPKGCIMENGNWCGEETSSYSDEAGCWKSGEECWAQSKTCWAEAPPTGGAGCTLWDAKCKAMNDACTAKNFNGPPNKGKDLTPTKSTIDVGVVLATQGGGVVDSPKTSAPAAPKSTSAATSAVAKPTPAEEAKAPEYTEGANYEAGIPAVETPKKTTITATEGAPTPTKAICPAGYHCVTKWTTVVKTEIVYATMYADAKRRSLHQRRHG